MYDNFGNFKADPYLHTISFGFRDKIISIKREHFFGKILWILHPMDNYGQHLERYYNSRYVKKKIKYLFPLKEDED